MVELMYVMNCYRRYDHPENLDPGFAKLAQGMIDTYLA